MKRLTRHVVARAALVDGGGVRTVSLLLYYFVLLLMLPQSQLWWPVTFQLLLWRRRVVLQLLVALRIGGDFGKVHLQDVIVFGHHGQRQTFFGHLDELNDFRVRLSRDGLAVHLNQSITYLNVYKSMLCTESL